LSSPQPAKEPPDPWVVRATSWTKLGPLKRSLDGGASWQRIAGGPSPYGVLSLAFDAAGDLAAGTYGGGVFRLDRD